MESEFLSLSDTIDKLLWPPDGVSPPGRSPGESMRMRLYNALRRNNVETIRDVVALSPDEILRFRNVGEGSLAELIGHLDKHGWKLAENKPYVPYSAEERAEVRRQTIARLPRAASRAPEGLEEAEWIGRQLDQLGEDSRVYPRNSLGGKATDTTTVQARRCAWRMFRWATCRGEDWPKTAGFDAYPLPGSVEVHLDGLNRLAHERLGS